MNVTAHQEKKKNEETKTGMKKTGEGKRQATDFKEAVCCPSAIVQRAAPRKNGSRKYPGNWDPREGQQPFRPNPYGVEDRITAMRRLLISAVTNIVTAIDLLSYSLFFRSRFYVGKAINQRLVNRSERLKVCQLSVLNG